MDTASAVMWALHWIIAVKRGLSWVANFDLPVDLQSKNSSTHWACGTSFAWQIHIQTPGSAAKFCGILLFPYS